MAPPPRVEEVLIELVRFVNLGFAFGGVIFMIIGVIIGLQWMGSQGDPDKIKELRSRLIYWVIGFVLFFLSVTIVITIYNVFDIKDCKGRTLRPGFSSFFETCP